MSGLVLSLFPGIGLLDMAFEEEGFCVVRGPDLLWGGDIRRFHPPMGQFDGVIGGPPCQKFSGLNNLAVARGVIFENLIPEFERVVHEAIPRWFVMENVLAAPEPVVSGYAVRAQPVDNRWFGGEQHRKRRISFGTFGGHDLHLQTAALESPIWKAAVTSAHAGARRVRAKGDIARYPIEEALRLQGLPSDFFGKACPLTAQGKLKVVAQGVPLPLGRAVARAVKAALGVEPSANVGTHVRPNALRPNDFQTVANTESTP